MDRCVSRSLSLSNSDFNVWLCLADGRRESRMHIDLIFFTVSSPFSYTCKKLPKDAENQFEAALGAVSALRQPYETVFMVRRDILSVWLILLLC